MPIDKRRAAQAAMKSGRIAPPGFRPPADPLGSSGGFRLIPADCLITIEISAAGYHGGSPMLSYPIRVPSIPAPGTFVIVGEDEGSYAVQAGGWHAARERVVIYLDNDDSVRSPVESLGHEWDIARIRSAVNGYLAAGWTVARWGVLAPDPGKDSPDDHDR